MITYEAIRERQHEKGIGVIEARRQLIKEQLVKDTEKAASIEDFRSIMIQIIKLF